MDDKRTAQTTPDYIVVANIIGDDLILPDGTRRNAVLGGAGTYAAAGMRIWSDSVGIVSGVGADFEQLYGSWFNRNYIDTQGLQVRASDTPRSWVNYQAADERTEMPQFGMDHFQMMEPFIHDLPARYQSARGLYLFRDTNSAYWDEVFSFQADHHPIIIWELHAGAAAADQWDHVAAILARVDLLSLNLSEARQLCQLAEPVQIVEKLLETGVKGVALRCGAQGSVVADQASIWQIPVVPANIVDVTGAGNAFTGGFLVGYCQSNSNILVAGQCGTVSASFMLQQFGPPEAIDLITRHDIETRLQTLTAARLK
jgi:sugar/nucleoside kinase (ribokinase family)